MGGYQVFVYPGVTELIGTEAAVRSFNAPDPDLRIQVFVDLGDYIWIFNDEL